MSSEPAAMAPSEYRGAGWVFLSLTRIAIGFTFLWAFFDKLFGLGFSTCRTTADDGTYTIDVMCDKAWVHGARITEGYLGSSTGPFADFFKNLGEQAWTDWPFMLGLFGIGFALCFGVGTRIALFAGPAMLMLMYISHYWPGQGANTSNPFVEEHLIESLAIIAIVLLELRYRQAVGFGEWWKRKVGVKNWTV
jgi:thiosulfate dehydrogenase [quinone] large subunit